MGKIVATYIVKVTAREPDDLPPAGEAVDEPPTIPALEAAVEQGVEGITKNLIFRASAERVDE